MKFDFVIKNRSTLLTSMLMFDECLFWWHCQTLAPFPIITKPPHLVYPIWLHFKVTEPATVALVNFSETILQPV